MGDGLRQSMAWLHTWAGLLTSWVLFFVFLTGTVGYVNSELDRWMKPELPLASSPPPASSLSPVAQKFLTREAQGAGVWYIQYPGQRNVMDLTVSWESPLKAGEDHGDYHSETLSPATGEPFERAARETGGGSALYYMHYTLHYIPYEWATKIVGICAMFMLVGILSGIVTHKKIFKDFFTFRPGKGQRSWLDGHNLLSVTALPYHLMITWTGLVFYMFAYMPIAGSTLYPDAAAIDDTVYAAVRGLDPQAEKPSASMAPLTAIAPLVAQADREWGGAKVRQVVVQYPGRANARIYISPLNIADHSGDTDGVLRFDGVSGERLPD
ncbi:MAG: PepSY domain-containing protein, partial [Burkholderiales bacterium]